ncbi:hypothetical protein METEAL_18900 [Mesoterricola silvestris]|uniref:histidine kinase n=2 Tax=Mesoterricola silvestris TaxID=2927979 RepID=A0AA48GH23_9BACT|nr:hypothetical protein METEAL_18900 [Mesoterricola silvestris]
MDALDQGVLLLDPDGRYVEANRAASRILGLDREALLEGGLEGSQTGLFLGDGSVLPVQEAPGRVVLRTGQPVRDRELVWTGRDGRRQWLHVSAEPLAGGGVLVNFSDITRRMRAAETLRSSEEKFSRSFHANPDSVAISRLSDGVYLTVNQAFLHTTGFREHEVLGRSSRPEDLDIWVDPRDRERFRELLQQDGKVLGFEAQFRRRDGGVLTGLISASRIDLDGEPCILTMTRDITEWKDQARRLERMTQLYAALSQVNQAIVWARTPQALMDMICEALVKEGRFALAWIGWHDPADAGIEIASRCGDPYAYLDRLRIPTDAPPERHGPAASALREGRPVIENDFLASSEGAPWQGAARRSGFASAAAFPIRKAGAVRAVLMVYAKQKGFFGTNETALLEEAASDASFALEHLELDLKRKEAEESLRRISAAVEQSPLGIVILDREWKVEYVNPRFTEMTGYSRPEIVGRNPIFMKAPSTPLKDFLQIRVALTQGGVWEGEFSSLRKDGGIFHERATIAPVRDGSGAVTHYITFNEDITEHKRAKEIRRSLEAQLVQAQKMESLGNLTGGIAHDMNNVLGAILGLATAKLAALPPDTPGYPTFETIAKAALRGGKMVRRLLTFARVIPEDVASLDLNAILLEEVELLENTLLAKVRLEIDLTPGLRPVRGDAGAISNAFLNLCVNARDAMAEAGTLTLRTRNVDARWVEIQVEDDGAGMTPEILARAQEPFFTTKPQGQGTGLGLSMVYGTVKAHQGEMEIQSRPGAGTRVTLRFPAADDALPEPAAAGPLPPDEAGPLDILVVDDDDMIRASIGEVLEVLGHRSTAFACGEDALADLGRGLHADLVILDMNMPGLGGAGTLPRLRELRPQLPVLLTTGRSDTAALELLDAYPSVAMLAKPFRLDDLKQSLRKFRMA